MELLILNRSCCRCFKTSHLSDCNHLHYNYLFGNQKNLTLQYPEVLKPKNVLLQSEASSNSGCRHWVLEAVPALKVRSSCGVESDPRLLCHVFSPFQEIAPFLNDSVSTVGRDSQQP